MHHEVERQVTAAVQPLKRVLPVSFPTAPAQPARSSSAALLSCCQNPAPHHQQQPHTARQKQPAGRTGRTATSDAAKTLSGKAEVQMAKMNMEMHHVYGN